MVEASLIKWDSHSYCIGRELIGILSINLHHLRNAVPRAFDDAARFEYVHQIRIDRFRNACQKFFFGKPIRELKKLGVDVFFEEQNLYSLSSEGELVLTFLASFAQEEARNVSENMKWRVKRNFEQGVPWSEPRTLGYEFQGKKMIVIPKEANLVRRIFDMYVGGMGFQAIANRLNEENIKAMHGGKWKKGIVVDDDSLSSYRGQLVVDEYTKEPTGLRYKDDHLYDDDGHDLGSFSDLGNFYPNR